MAAVLALALTPACLQSMPDVLRVKQAVSGLASPFVCVSELTDLKLASVGVRCVCSGTLSEMHCEMHPQTII